jgi:hypothetical protein
MLAASMLVGAAALGILLSVARPGPKGPTPTDGENRQSSIPAGTVQPSLEAAPDPSGPPPAATSAIRPGSVNRTSIHLSATYDAEVTLGFDDRTLGVNVAISVTNRSGGDVDRVELNTIAAPLGNLKLGPTTVDGAPIEATVRDQTIVVPLGGVLPDGATAMLRVQYRARIPTGLSGSKWMFTRTNGTLQASRWLPWVGLRHPFSRPNDGDPFFTALSPSVTVRITTDRKLVIATPGRRVAVEGLTQTFEAENVRDFHIVASPSFSVRELRVAPWTIRAYVHRGFPTNTVLDQAADALRRMSRLADDYPYPVLTIVQTAGGWGLEGPGMIWIPDGLSTRWQRWTVYHEIAHQWFYGMVGSDGASDPFADEAVATHLGQVVSGIWGTTSCPMRRLDLSIYRYTDRCYFGQIYFHGADLLERLRRTMEPGEYWRGIRDYVAAHRFGLGSTRELLRALQVHTEHNLRPILAPWFPSLY